MFLNTQRKCVIFLYKNIFLSSNNFCYHLHSSKKNKLIPNLTSEKNEIYHKEYVVSQKTKNANKAHYITKQLNDISVLE